MNYSLDLSLEGLLARNGRFRPALSLNFLQGYIDPRITFARASGGWRTNPSGLSELVGVDVPRLDYDPATLQPRGLLIEGARTNMLLWSKDYSNAYWIKNVPGSLTLTANADVALDGTMTADRFATAAASCGVYRVGVHAGLAIGATVTMSIAIKPLSGYCKIRMGFDGTAFTTAQQGIFDLIAGTDAVFGAANTRKMTLLPNGYWLLSLTAAATAAGDASVSIYAHDATVQSFCVDYSQSEAGAFASTYTATTAAPVTRAADSAAMMAANFSRFFNASEGTFVVEVLRNLLFTSSFVMSAARVTPGYGPRHQLGFGGTDRLVYAVVDDASSVAVGGLGAVVSGIGPNKLAAAYKANDFAASLNGASVLTDILGTPPTGLDALYIGADESGFNNLFGHIRRIDYYRTRLSNADLQRLAA